MGYWLKPIANGQKLLKLNRQKRMRSKNVGCIFGTRFFQNFLKKNKHQLGSVKIFKSLKALVQWPGDFLKLDSFFRVKKKSFLIWR